jgi:hypothetical protein
MIKQVEQKLMCILLDKTDNFGQGIDTKVNLPKPLICAISSYTKGGELIRDISKPDISKTSLRGNNN